MHIFENVKMLSRRGFVSLFHKMQSKYLKQYEPINKLKHQEIIVKYRVHGLPGNPGTGELATCLMKRLPHVSPDAKHGKRKTPSR